MIGTLVHPLSEYRATFVMQAFHAGDLIERYPVWWLHVLAGTAVLNHIAGSFHRAES